MLQTFLQRDVRALTQVNDELSILPVFMCGSQLYRQYDQLCGAGQGSGDHCANGEAVAEGTGSGGAGIFTGAVHASEFKIWCEAPKVYFTDTGLAAYLLRWSNAEILEAGAMSSSFLETWAVMEIYKSFSNCGQIPPLGITVTLTAVR